MTTTPFLVPDIDSPPLPRYGLPEYRKATSPAAGANFSETVEGFYYLRLVSVFCRVVTSSTAAQRTVMIEYLDAEGNRYALSGDAVVQNASETVDYHFSAFREVAAGPVAATMLLPLQHFLILPTHSWKITVNNIDTTDAITRIRVVQERFFTGVSA